MTAASVSDSQRIGKEKEQIRELIEAGFEYVTDRDGAKIYRKRK